MTFRIASIAALLFVSAAASFPNAGRAQDRTFIPASKVYWTDPSSGKIQRANLDGTDVDDVVTGIVGPWRIAVDRQGSKVYWTLGTAPAATDGKIQRANLDGTNIETIVDQSSDKTSDIALDTRRGKLYWSIGHDIRRANLDGTEQEVVITDVTEVFDGIPLGPRAFDVDPLAERVYWTIPVDIFHDSLRSSALDGSDRQAITLTTCGHRDLSLDPSTSLIAFAKGPCGGPAPTQVLGAVGVMDTGGSFDQVVPVYDPAGAALDGMNGKIFWTENEVQLLPNTPPVGETAVRTANADASDPQTLITGSASTAGIALDSAVQRMAATPPTPVSPPREVVDVDLPDTGYGASAARPITLEALFGVVLVVSVVAVLVGFWRRARPS